MRTVNEHCTSEYQASHCSTFSLITRVMMERDINKFVADNKLDGVTETGSVSLDDVRTVPTVYLGKLACRNMEQFCTWSRKPPPPCNID